MRIGTATWPRGILAGAIALFALQAAPAAAQQRAEPARPAVERHAFLGDLGTTTPPVGWRQFCRDFPADCHARPASVGLVQLDRGAWATLVRINAHVNTAIEPVTDMEQYGVEERWTYPVSGRGDCEDYVLLKKQLLIRAGLPASALLVTVVRDRNGDGHAILTVRTDRGDYVLDNENDEIRPWHQTGYRFVKRQAAHDPNQWVSVGPASDPAAVASR